MSDGVFPNVWVALVPKLRLGHPEGEAPASRDGKLELPGLSSQAGAWELALEFLGIWEGIYNPDFNYGEFAIIKIQAGLNSYKLSAKKSELTEAATTEDFSVVQNEGGRAIRRKLKKMAGYLGLLPSSSLVTTTGSSSFPNWR